MHRRWLECKPLVLSTNQPASCTPAPIHVQVLVDVVGVLVECKPLGSVKRKTDQVELSRRDVTLVDQRWALVWCWHSADVVGAGRGGWVVHP